MGSHDVFQIKKILMLTFLIVNSIYGAGIHDSHQKKNDLDRKNDSQNTIESSKIGKVNIKFDKSWGTN